MNPKLVVMTRLRGGWFSRADAAAAGYSDSEIRRRLRLGKWSRLCRDAYAEIGVPADERFAWERAERWHKLLSRVVLQRLDATSPSAINRLRSSTACRPGVWTSAWYRSPGR
ncbi:type IV toxin-antitoxin system AbiEi family antitoxin domain-containing protein [Kribbella sp. CA-253562]|uniref:type IV toxin-antitoxin system AbiEi family antitoxin domain-containing protein n=1 Tax=Kribbella sp. CA-253562 TaxID=3239942 RepID=UPI003D9106CD